MYGFCVFGEARFVEDVELAEKIHPLSKQWGFRAVACLRIQHGGRTLGALHVKYAEPHVFGEIEKNIQGIAVFPTHASVEATLIDRADAALYRAKARGRDQICITAK